MSKKIDIGMGVGIDAEMAAMVADDDNDTSPINTEQPKPIAAERTPAWDLVIAYVKQVFPPADEEPIVKTILADMAERDQVGRQRYGMPLTAFNGRDQLVDAYQEGLDYAVYLMAKLDELGVHEPEKSRPAPQTLGFSGQPNEPTFAELLGSVFVNHMAHLPLLRQLMLEEQATKAKKP